MSTKEHVTLRLPSDLMIALKEQAKIENRTVAYVITSCCRAVLCQDTKEPSPKCMITADVSHIEALQEKVSKSKPAKCPKDSSHTGWQRSDDYWCVTCRKSYA